MALIPVAPFASEGKKSADRRESIFKVYVVDKIDTARQIRLEENLPRCGSCGRRRKQPTSRGLSSSRIYQAAEHERPADHRQQLAPEIAWMADESVEKPSGLQFMIGLHRMRRRGIHRRRRRLWRDELTADSGSHILILQSALRRPAPFRLVISVDQSVAKKNHRPDAIARPMSGTKIQKRLEASLRRSVSLYKTAAAAESRRPRRRPGPGRRTHRHGRDMKRKSGNTPTPR